MGDPWKSITPKGVQAFVNATLATLLVWLSIENHLAMVINYMSNICLLYTSPSPRDQRGSRMPSSA